MWKLKIATTAEQKGTENEVFCEYLENSKWNFVNDCIFNKVPKILRIYKKPHLKNSFRPRDLGVKRSEVEKKSPQVMTSDWRQIALESG